MASTPQTLADKTDSEDRIRAEESYFPSRADTAPPSRDTEGVRDGRSLKASPGPRGLPPASHRESADAPDSGAEPVDVASPPPSGRGRGGGRGRGWWLRLIQALDLSGCGSCHSASTSSGGEGCGCARGSLCRAEAEGRPDQCPDGGRGPGGGRFRWRRRRGRRAAARENEFGRLTLDRMRPGGRGLIQEVNGVGVLRRRLLEMGVLPGTPFKVERVAPLGDPIEIRVRGYALSLRRNEAAHILVETEG